MRIAFNSWIKVLICIGIANIAAAQTKPPTAQKKSDQVKVDWADEFYNIQEGDKIIQKLRGNVELRQDSVYMYCDSATIENSIYVVAKGNVLIQQGDTTNVFADSVVYWADLKQASLFGNVALINNTQKLFTERLDYDVSTKIATYFEGATLTNNETQLSSRRGYYYVRNNEIFFRDSVVVIDPEFSLRSDTLKFNTESRTVFFLAPTLITTDSSKIYCEDGFYDTYNNLAEFRENAQYARGETQQATADTIRYDGKNRIYILKGDAHFTGINQEAVANTIRYEENNDKYYLTGNASYRDSTRNIVAEDIIYDRKNELYSTKGRSRIIDPPQILEADAVAYTELNGTGVASGNVIWQDTSANLTILCERSDFNRKTNYIKATGGQRGRPLLITEIDNDSLFLSSDTLLALQTLDSLSSDTVRTLFAYNRVRIYKSNLQGICDSLTYTSTDSIFHLYKEPILWSDTSQFVADTMDLQLRNDQIDRIFLHSNAFIVNSADQIFFNQVKGRDITAFFEENELRKMDVQGNAESVYYAKDDENAYIGVNKILCSEMMMYFGNNNIDEIRFYAQPKANLIPMKQADHETLKIEGFSWEITKRPKNRDDVFIEIKTEPPIPLTDEKTKTTGN
ncbi:MAG: OstA-like protein [Saprospiraceae bacterium]|nr:OstA-like protein [Saprospiraceae bacterium]